MFLETVNTTTTCLTADCPALPGSREVFAPWVSFPYTCIAHHGDRCCHAALAWLTGMDQAQLQNENLYLGPRWLRARYDWGPMQHPAYWCEVVRHKKLDCGAQAAVARTVFESRGIECLPLQLVQRYNADSAAHWYGTWQEKNCDPHWVIGEYIYHESCAVVLPDGHYKFWDPSSACWIEPATTSGYGSVAALKVSTPLAAASAPRYWGPHLVPANEWMVVAGS